MIKLTEYNECHMFYESWASNKYPYRHYTIPLSHKSFRLSSIKVNSKYKPREHNTYSGYDNAKCMQYSEWKQNTPKIKI